MLSSTFGRSMNENDVVLSLSVGYVSIGVEGIRFLTEVGNNELGVSNLLAEGSAGDGSRGWARLLEYPGDDGVLGSSTTIFGLLTVAK